MDWKPLPKRKRFVKDIVTVKKEAVVTDPTAPAVATQSYTEEGEAEAEAGVSSSAEAGLAARDGCAGDFYEYLDHTADVQCHAWGSTMSAALQHLALCMCNYMTDLTNITIDPEESLSFTASGHDMHSLLFKFLDEILYRFCTDSFCPKEVHITSLDRDKFTLEVRMEGCIFDPAVHGQGTEIKAITFSNMQIHETPARIDLYVIVDI